MEFVELLLVVIVVALPVGAVLFVAARLGGSGRHRERTSRAARGTNDLSAGESGRERDAESHRKPWRRA